MIQHIKKRLQESYPDSSDFRTFIREALAISVFIFAFLYFFQPFGLSELAEGKFLICLAFGGITFAICLIYEIFLSYVLGIKKDIPTWTLGKWLLSTLLLISLISVGNHFFQSWLMGGKLFRPVHMLQSFLSTLGIGVFPVVFIGLYNQLRVLHKNMKEAETIAISNMGETTAGSRIIKLPSVNKKQNFQLQASQLLYLEAMQNYVLVFYLKEGLLEKEILRNTLSQLEKVLDDGQFFRCHRSYLVNLKQISQVEGNAQGLKLYLGKNFELSVPVSRKKIPQLKYRLSQKAASHP